MTQGVLVVGSINHDSLYFLDHLPQAHETRPAHTFITAPGGKGANQAVACALSTEREVQLLGCVGQDMHAGVCTAYLKENGVDLSDLVVLDDKPTGTACVMVEDSGDNLIVISAGANGAVSPQIISDARPMFERCDTVLLQLEIPLESVRQCLADARALGKKSILNPAPYVSGVEQFVSMADIVTPNQAEASALTGLPVVDEISARKAATAILAMGVERVVITLGGEGSLVASQTDIRHISAYPVSNLVDTTGAGDVYNGSLAAALTDGANLVEAADFASAAASISVQKASASYCAPRKSKTISLQRKSGRI